MQRAGMSRTRHDSLVRQSLTASRMERCSSHRRNESGLEPTLRTRDDDGGSDRDIVERRSSHRCHRGTEAVKRYVALARVSSREQEREGFSLEVQESALKNFAERSGGEIAKFYRLAE